MCHFRRVFACHITTVIGVVTQLLKLLTDVINPYVEKVKEKMNLPIDQKVLLI